VHLIIDRYVEKKKEREREMIAFFFSLLGRVISEKAHQ
jgi:hypothetical protein